jgi:hypothetical protein
MSLVFVALTKHKLITSRYSSSSMIQTISSMNNRTKVVHLYPGDANISLPGDLV